jgi:hypothetical protein
MSIGASRPVERLAGLWPTVLAGGLLALVPSASIPDGPPSLLAPLPLVPFTLLVCGVPKPLTGLTASVLFWAWNPGLVKGRCEVPLRSRVAVGVLSALSFVWAALNWRDGVDVQGVAHVTGIAVVNVGMVVALVALGVRRIATPSFARNLVFHWGLVAWLFWFAFPYLGPHP